jgi:hypothetical protein
MERGIQALLPGCAAWQPEGLDILLLLVFAGILFNWHPVLMTLGFAVLMTEAVLAYKSPWQRSFSR